MSHTVQMEDEAGHLDAIELTPDNLTRLNWRWVRFDSGNILTPKVSY